VGAVHIPKVFEGKLLNSIPLEIFSGKAVEQHPLEKFRGECYSTAFPRKPLVCAQHPHK
jgi:hypothetical protein